MSKLTKTKEWRKEYMRNWREQHPLSEQQKQKMREYNKKRDYQKWYREKIKNDPEFIKKRKEYYEKNKAYFQQKSRECYIRTKQRVQERQRTERKKALKGYGNKCNCCGETIMEFLALDHVNNDGYKHRKTTKLKMYKWVIKNNFPKNIQILCHNCNNAKAFYGYCPHNDRNKSKFDTTRPETVF